MKEILEKEISEGLTGDQLKALKRFISWLDNDDITNPFILTGYAGSGKTFLSMRILQHVENKNLCWTVVAPTHKAVGVLRNYLLKDDLSPTWYPSTLHRLLRLKLKRKNDIELCEKTNQTDKSLENLDLVLIDESSMIDSSLLEILLECAYSNKTRVVFVGDPAQLPPVNESQSPIFFLKRSCKVILKQVVRHQGPVLRLASFVRDCSIPCESPPFLEKITNQTSNVECIEATKWLEKAKNSLKIASQNDNPDYARILCYTNRTLEKLVPHARRAIHGDMADQLPVLPGEVLITRSAIMASASFNDHESEEEPDMLLGSNRELIVQDIKPVTFDLNEFGLLNHINEDDFLIQTLKVNVKSGDSDLELRLLPPLGSSGRSLLDKHLIKLKNKAKSSVKSEVKLAWRRFFLMRDSFACLGPASVLTVHRSQGSTFENVYLASDIFWPKEIILRRQLAYVAITRAQKSVCLIGRTCNSTVSDLWINKIKS